MLVWAVVSDSLQEAVELVTSREEAEAIVQAWDRDEPERAGALRVELIEFRTGTAMLGLSCRKDGSPDLLLPLIATGILLTPVRAELRIAVENHVKRERALGSENAGKR
jgi:hypothetical protein